MSVCTRCGRTTAYLTDDPEPICLACATNTHTPPYEDTRK
jgi:hypothetical protein